MNIIFYSSDCKFCYKLMSIMKNMNILQNFKLICTDNNNNLPSNISTVPTLIVSNINKPLEGKEAFVWLNNYRTMQKNNINIENKKKIFLMNELNKSNDKMLNYDSNSNFSDLFTFIDNNNISQNTTFADPTLNIPIFTAPELDKIDEKQQNDAIEQLINKRKMQDKKHIK